MRFIAVTRARPPLYRETGAIDVDDPMGGEQSSSSEFSSDESDDEGVVVNRVRTSAFIRLACKTQLGSR